MKGLKNIKTACGNAKKRSSGRIQSAVSRSHSFIGSQQNRQQSTNKQSTYKPTMTKPAPPIKRLGVQECRKFKPEILVKDNCIKISIPQANHEDIRIYKDILSIEDAIECLLPFEVQPSFSYSYDGEILHIELKRK